MSTRVALITGSAQGIGEAIALRLSKDDIDIALLDIPAKHHQLEVVAEQIETHGRRALVITADVSDEEQVKSAIAKTVEILGSLDIVRFFLLKLFCPLITSKP